MLVVVMQGQTSREYVNEFGHNSIIRKLNTGAAAHPQRALSIKLEGRESPRHKVNFSKDMRLADGPFCPSRYMRWENLYITQGLIITGPPQT